MTTATRRRRSPDSAASDSAAPVDAALVSAGHLFDAECALHVARQSHVDAWIAAASDRLHEAVLEHDQALASRNVGGRA
jgi:hypothetical protein